MAEILTDSEFDEVSERIVERFPHDDNYDHELLSADLCRECSGAVDDHKANCIVPEIHRLIASHRALAAELTQWKEDYKLCQDGLNARRELHRETVAERVELEAQVRALGEALNEAKELIKIWHGFKDEDEKLWRIYDTQSPEMKRINATLTGATELGYKAMSRFRERAVRAIRASQEFYAEEQQTENAQLHPSLREMQRLGGMFDAANELASLVESLPLEPEQEEKL